MAVPGWIYLFFLAWIAAYSTAFDTLILSVNPIDELVVERIVSNEPELSIFGVHNFSLINFNKHIHAYNAEETNLPVALLVKKYKNQKTTAINHSLQVPLNVNISRAIGSLDDLDYFLKKTNFEGPKVVIISSEEAFTRESKVRTKRDSAKVGFDDMDVKDSEISGMSDDRQRSSLLRSRAGADTISKYDMPVLLPPINTSSSGHCLLYMEELRVVVINKVTRERRYAYITSNGINKYGWDSSYCNCSKMTNFTTGYASFTIDIMTGKIASEGNDFSLDDSTNIKIQLDFTGVQATGYWNLSSFEILSDFVLKPGQGQFLSQDLTVRAGTVKNMSFIGGVYRYSFACSEVPLIYFDVSNDYALGFGMSNLQVDLRMLQKPPQFNNKVCDCVGTFSVGTWMGIFIMLIFIFILLFGYLMVQSIQTTDRYDDSKQKQIVINFKE